MGEFKSSVQVCFHYVECASTCFDDSNDGESVSEHGDFSSVCQDDVQYV